VRRVQQDVNVVHDSALHDVDAMRWVAGGEVKRVFAEAQSGVIMPFEDSVAGLLRFESGAVGSLEVTWLSPRRVRELSVLGEKGLIVAGYADFRSPTLELQPFGAREGVAIPIEPQEPLAAELAAFVAAVRDGAPLLVTADDGLAALAVCDARTVAPQDLVETEPGVEARREVALEQRIDARAAAREQLARGRTTVQRGILDRRLRDRVGCPAVVHPRQKQRAERRLRIELVFLPDHELGPGLVDGFGPVSFGDEAHHRLRETFRRAPHAAPCVLFGRLRRLPLGRQAAVLVLLAAAGSRSRRQPARSGTTTSSLRCSSGSSGDHHPPGPPTAVERTAELHTQDGRSAGMGERRAGRRIKLAAEDLADEVVRQRAQISVGRAAFERSRSAHTR